MKKICSLLLAFSIFFSALTCGTLGASAEAGALPLDGTIISGVVTEINVHTPLNLVVEQRGKVEITFSLNFFAEVDLRQKDNYDKRFLLSPSDDIDFEANTDIHRTLYLEKGTYTVNFIKGAREDLNYRIAAKWSAFDFAEKAPSTDGSTIITMPCNKELTCSLTEWTMGDTFNITVKKEYKIILNFTAYCPMDVYSSSMGIDETVEGATAEQPKTLTVEKMLKPGSYSFFVHTPLGYITTVGGIYKVLMSVENIPVSPTKFKTITRKADRLTISYNAVKGIDGYQVQCSDGGTKWAQTKTGKSTSVCFKGLQQGGSYKFRVRTYVVKNGEKQFGLWSKTYADCIKPATPKIYGFGGKYPHQIYLNWRKPTGVCTGYQVWCSTDAKFKNIVKKANVPFSGRELQGAVFFDFKSGKTYYFRVRAYSKGGANICYSTWSAAKSVKVK